jgi:hypothetical protein
MRPHTRSSMKSKELVMTTAEKKQELIEAIK